VQTDAWHHRTDAITSIAAFIGISVALIGGEPGKRGRLGRALRLCVIGKWLSLLRPRVVRDHGHGAARKIVDQFDMLRLGPGVIEVENA
jgi:divalent metal cation (Fe/Co/Zn/Cd) transporter